MCIERCACTLIGVLLQAKQSHKTIPGEIRVVTAGRIDGNGHLNEIVIEQEYDVVRQACLSEASGTSEIDKQNGDASFFTKFLTGHSQRSSQEIRM